MIVKSYKTLVAGSSRLQSALLLAIRLFWGWAFAKQGWLMLQDIDTWTGYHERLGIPFAAGSVVLAGIVQCLCGVLLALGLAARLACIPLFLVVVGTFATVHRDATLRILQDPETFVAQDAFPLLLAALIVFAFGPGRLSADWFIAETLVEKVERKKDAKKK